MPKQFSRATFLVLLFLITEGLLTLGALFYNLTPITHQCNVFSALSWHFISTPALLGGSFLILILSLSWALYQLPRFSLWTSLGWLLFLGGGLANTLERFQRGCVRDSLSFGFGIINNPADWSLAIGGLLLVVYYGRKSTS